MGAQDEPSGHGRRSVPRYRLSSAPTGRDRDGLLGAFGLVRTCVDDVVSGLLMLLLRICPRRGDPAWSRHQARTRDVCNDPVRVSFPSTTKSGADDHAHQDSAPDDQGRHRSVFPFALPKPEGRVALPNNRPRRRRRLGRSARQRCLRRFVEAITCRGGAVGHRRQTATAVEHDDSIRPLVRACDGSALEARLGPCDSGGR